MASFDIYLNLPGNTEEAFNFYKSVLGGEFIVIMRYKDSPGCENMPAELQNKVMHIALPVGKGNILMGTDSMDDTKEPKLQMGNNVSISVSPDSVEEAKRIFDGLSVGGKVYVPFEKAFWGAHFGMFLDKFGIQWMVNYDEKKPQ